MSIEKIYGIGQFAHLTGVSIDTLRFYEKRHLIQPNRGDNNRRQYTNEDAERIALIKRLRGGGFTVREIQTYIIAKQQGVKTITQRRDYLQHKLADLHQKQADLQVSVNYVEDKIQLLGQQLADLTAMNKE